MKRCALVSLASIVAIGVLGTGTAGASSAPTQYFTVVATSATATPTVVAAGPISATGTYDAVRNHFAKLVFPDGSVSVRHEPPLTDKQHFNPRTCVFTEKETGTYSITRGSGAYARASGAGRYKVSFIAQGCDPNEPPTSFVETVVLRGPLAL